MKEARDAYFILDKEGRIQFLNRKAEEITGRSKEDLVGTYFEDAVKITEGKKGNIKDRHIKTSGNLLRTLLRTQNETISVEIHSNPIRLENNEGKFVTVRLTSQQPSYLHSLEVVGSAIQRHSSAQKIYETLREALSDQGIAFMVFPLDNGFFSIGYHTFDKKKMNMTEFIMGIPLSEIKLTLVREAFKRVTEQKSLFFSDISSIFESATPRFPTRQLHKFFSLADFSKGVVVPITFGEALASIMVMVSEELRPEDAPAVSTLGVQISAALERAAHFEQMVADLKALEEQINSRTRELVRVKSHIESIVQSSVDAIMAADIEGRITFVNKGVETMFGYKEADILGQKITKYYAGGKKEAKRLRTVIMKEGHIENTELDFLTKDGRVLHTLASLSQLKNEKGMLTGIMAVLKDVTEQKRLQQTLESLNKAAFRIQKSRTREEIFAVAAEELKQLDLHVMFMLFNEKKTAGKIVHISRREALCDLETSVEKTLEECEFPLNHRIYKDLIKKKEAVFVQDLGDMTRLIVPPILLDVCEEGLALLGFADKMSILAPLIIHDETIGYLAVISGFITPRDIPSVMAFANQVSTALENARLLEESRKRTDELAKNLEEQQMLRELNTKLFVAQSQDEVLDAAIEGIHKLGTSFSNITLLNEERTHATVVRLEMESMLMKAAERIVRAFVPKFTVLGYSVPVWEEGSIFHEFFQSQIPLITSDIDINKYPVMKAELSEVYAAFGTEASGLQSILQNVRRILPYKSFMVLPIIVGGSTIGSLAVTNTEAFSEEDFILMRTVAEMVSSAMERITHSERLTETLNELRAVQRINTLLNMGASFHQILIHIASSIKEVYHYQFAFPVLLDPSREYLTFEYVTLSPRMAKKVNSAFGGDLRRFKYPVFEESPILNQVLVEKKCVILKGFEELAEGITHEGVSSAVKKLSREFPKALGFDSGEISIMIVPLPYGEEVIGILILGHRKSLTEEDFHHLEYFLDQVSIAIAKSDVESRLRQSLEELRELDQMKSEFIDIASHELRTPLTTLKLYLEMMALEQYGKLSEPLKKRINVMEEGVNRLEEIINQTLVASRLIKNKLRLEKKPVSLVDVATEAIHQLRPLWIAKNQNIFLESHPTLSEVEGDRKALFTAVSNLVDNAIRYSPENTEILIRFLEHTTEVECVVIDQGYGIPSEHVEKIFDEFYIVPSGTEYARMDGRTGLGLFIARGIVERHGGKIWVKSILGEGSTFHFVLPKEKSQ